MTTEPARWPQAELSSVRRLEILAAALPGAQLARVRVPHAFERVWSYVADLERSIPEFDQFVTRVRVRSEPDPGRLDVRVHLRFGPPQPYTVHLEPGFMWMQAPARLYLVGLAAAPAGGNETEVAHLEATRLPLGRGAGRRILAGHVRADLDALARRLDEQSG